MGGCGGVGGMGKETEPKTQFQPFFKLEIYFSHYRARNMEEVSKLKAISFSS